MNLLFWKRKKTILGHPILTENMLPSDVLSLGWCKYFHAIDGKGRPTLIRDEKAVAWCLAGAIVAVQTTISSYQYDQTLRNVLFNKRGSRSIIDFNDSYDTTKEDVIEVAKETERKLGLR